MTILFNALVLLMLVTSLSCSPPPSPDKAAAIEIQRAAIIKELATLHNAITNTEIEIGSDQRTPFSYELQQMLLCPTSRPLLVEGMIEDISIRNGRVQMEMQDDLGQTFSTFRLSLDSNMVFRIRASSLHRYDPVAVVARITAVEKVAFEIRSSFEELDMSVGDAYIVMGECIDFRTVPK